MDKTEIDVRRSWNMDGRNQFLADVKTVSFYGLLIFGTSAFVFFLCFIAEWFRQNFGILPAASVFVGALSTIGLCTSIWELPRMDTKEYYVNCVKNIWWCGSLVAVCIVLFLVGVFF